MINLKDVISKYPECLESSEKLRAYLTDLYPNKKAKVSIIVAIFNCGIAEEIKNMNTIDEMALSRFCNRLENDFGYSQKLAHACLEGWVLAYDKNAPIHVLETKDITIETLLETPQKPKPTVSSARKERVNNDFIINNGVLIECKKSKNKCESIEIPNGVIAIADKAFRDFCNLKNVVIPNTVQRIGVSAFQGCHSLTSIIIPNGVTVIDDLAFSNCFSLRSVTISSSVNSIGDRAFCLNKLEEIFVSADNPVFHSANNCLIDTERRRLIVGCKNSVIPADGSVTVIDVHAFENCTDLQTIEIPDSVTVIGKLAFAGCTNLVKVVIPKSVQRINDCAFMGCSHLEIVRILSTDTFVDYNTFERCNNLTLYVLKGSIAESHARRRNIKYVIENEDELYDLVNLDDFVIEDGLLKKYIGENNDIVVVPEGVTSIGVSAFEGIEDVFEVILPDTVTIIENSAFSHCDGLERIKIPNSVDTIEAAAFYDCSHLEEITMPQGITKIADATFAYCLRLSSVILPDSVTKISDFAFLHCDNLYDITLSENVEDIAYNAFEECNVTIHSKESSYAIEFAEENGIDYEVE